MKYLKRIGITTVVIGVVSLWFYFSAKSDYDWANLIIEQETPNGWTLIATLDNSASLTAPWTLIKTPITGLWFINNKNTKKLNQEIYLIQTLHVDYDYSRTEKSEYWELVNIVKKESVILDSKQDPYKLNFDKLEWHKYEVGMPGHQIIEYITKYDKNI